MNEPNKPTRQFPTGANLERKQEIFTLGPNRNDQPTVEQQFQALHHLLVTGETDAAYQEAKGNDSPPAEEYAVVTCPECEYEFYEDETGPGNICDECQTSLDELEAEYDEDDGQPSELQEWHDFDPDC